MARMHRHGEESGAVAVVVALLSIVLVGISAFTIDFGMSYASTRQLQTASDAAVLAGAAAYKNSTGTCSVLAADAVLRTNADNAANALRNQNRDASTGSITSVSCTDDGLGLKVTYSSNGHTPSFIGPIFGHSGDYDTTRTATAELRVPDGVKARPYALCAGQIPTNADGTLQLPSNVFRMEMPSTGNSICPGPDQNGNWWSIDCPEATSNGTTDLGTTTAYGCVDPIEVVPNQAPRTGATLRQYLINSCHVRTSYCLSSNPGNLRGVPIAQGWDVLVNSHEKIVLPVFCSTPECDQAAISADGGNNRIYPVHALIGVIICGYHFSNGPSQERANDGGMTGDCGPPYNPNNFRTSDAGANYLLLRVLRIQVSGKSDDSDCAIGDPSGCDMGLRKVRLTK